MDRTIKEIADLLGVSKQAIRQRINKLPNTCYYVGNNNTIYVTEEGFKLLDSKASSRTTKADTKVEPSIEALIKQLDTKDRQIEELTKSLQFEQAKNRDLADRVFLLEQKDTQEVQEAPKRKWYEFFKA